MSTTKNYSFTSERPHSYAIWQARVDPGRHVYVRAAYRDRTPDPDGLPNVFTIEAKDITGTMPERVDISRDLAVYLADMLRDAVDWPGDAETPESVE